MKACGDITGQSSSLLTGDDHAIAGLPRKAEAVRHQPFSLARQAGVNGRSFSEYSPAAARHSPVPRGQWPPWAMNPGGAVATPADLEQLAVHPLEDGEELFPETSQVLLDGEAVELRAVVLAQRDLSCSLTSDKSPIHPCTRRALK